MNRRKFSRTLLTTAAVGATALENAGAQQQQQTYAVENKRAPDYPAEGWITDVEGITVGHFTDARRPTGCTVVLCERGGVCGVDVRGGWPGTRLTDALDPVKGASNTIKIDGVVLSGGSNFGLATAAGVEQYLLEKYLKERGPQARPRAFAVPAAIIYDLGLGDWKITPNHEAGYRACLAAAGGRVAEGNVGAGAGGTAGKMLGMKYAMKTGLGTASIKVGETGVVVGAIVAVNALGDVIDPRTGRIVAGARTADGKNFANAMGEIRGGRGVKLTNTNTTIGVVATNASFNKTEMNKIAQMASAGLARALNPVYTSADGDTIFAVSTGTLPGRASHSAVGAIAAEAVAEAIVRAALNAQSIPNFPGYRDFARANSM